MDTQAVVSVELSGEKELLNGKSHRSACAVQLAAVQRGALPATRANTTRACVLLAAPTLLRGAAAHHQRCPGPPQPRPTHSRRWLMPRTAAPFSSLSFTTCSRPAHVAGHRGGLTVWQDMGESLCGRTWGSHCVAGHGGVECADRLAGCGCTQRSPAFAGATHPCTWAARRAAGRHRAAPPARFCPWLGWGCAPSPGRCPGPQSLF